MAYSLRAVAFASVASAVLSAQGGQAQQLDNTIPLSNEIEPPFTNSIPFADVIPEELKDHLNGATIAARFVALELGPDLIPKK